MNLVNILSRKNSMKRAFVALESDMDDMLNEEFMLPPEVEAALANDEQAEPLAPEMQEQAAPAAMPEEEPTAEPVEERPAERMTAHAQNRITDIAAYDESRSTMQQQFDTISSALTKILSAHHLGRDFLDDCYTDVRRANELELAAASLSTENRKLGDRLDKLEKLRGRYDQLIDVLKRREAKLLGETDMMREELASAKLEAVEARSAASRAELASSEMHTTLAARSSEAERYMRENELLREKNVGLALDLDKALQRQAETRRKFEDLSSLHASETARIAKTAAKLASEEKESARLQQLADSLDQKLHEANETIAGFNRDMNEREELYQSEIHVLRSENQGLVSRIQAGVTDQTETSAEINALNTRLNEAEAAKTFAERKLADTVAEAQTERAWQASQHERQLKEMRAKVDDLTRTVASLRQQKAATPAKPDQLETFPSRPRTRSTGRRSKAGRVSA
jgi:chromosome segregation ATPase